jgi:hypothetical protein
MRTIARGPVAGSRPAEAFHEDDRAPMPLLRAIVVVFPIADFQRLAHA